MKRVCMIIPSFTAKGGIASVVSGYRNSELEKMYDVRYIETYSDGNKFQKVWMALKAYIKFVFCLVSWKPDIIHIHSSFGASFYRKLPFIYLASWCHKPIVNHIHGSAIGDLYTNASKKKQQLVEKTFNKCDKLIVLSEEWKQIYNKFVDEIKISVIENYSVVHEKKKEKGSHVQVLFLGFLSEAKGCYDIPLIAKTIIEENPNVEFVLAGDGRNEEVLHIKELVSECQLQENFCFPGWIRGDEKENAHERADVFMLPSYSEAMPMSILEAMGYGLPIISSNVGGIPQLIQQNVNGVMCNPGNIEEFTTALKKMVRDESLMRKMGEKSKEIVRERYSIESHIQKINMVYSQLWDCN